MTIFTQLNKMRGGVQTTDGILAPINKLATDLRARQSKCYDDGEVITRQIDDLKARYTSVMAEGDRAGRVALQLEEVTL